MRIAVTGVSSGFGKYLISNLEGSYGVSLRQPVEELIKQISTANILINHAYSNDTKQSQLLYEMFNLWKDEDKTIVNFGSAAILENATFDPMYVANKKHLNNLSNSLVANSSYKKLRVINFNPSTLENNKIFPENYNKLEFEQLLKILKFIIELPQSVEVSNIVISNTQRLKKDLL